MSKKQSNMFSFFSKAPASSASASAAPLSKPTAKPQSSTTSSKPPATAAAVAAAVAAAAANPEGPTIPPVGTKVEIYLPNDDEWYFATIDRVHEDGDVDVIYDWEGEHAEETKIDLASHMYRVVSHCGNFGYSGGEDNRLVMWDLRTGDVVSERTDVHTELVVQIAVAASGAFVATCDTNPSSDESPKSAKKPTFPNIAAVLDSSLGPDIINLHNRMYGCGKDPNVPFDELLKEIEELGLEPWRVLPAMIADTEVGRKKYNTPSPRNKQQPGANRNIFTGALTANILKALQGGDTFAGYSGAQWQGVHMHHTTKLKTMEGNKLFRSKLEGVVLKEVRTLQALTAAEHDQGEGTRL